MTKYNVRVSGAIGDGVHNDTAAIQRAVDACSEAGGGTVHIPAGTYLTGTIFLRNDITLFLDAGCTLLASTNQADYHYSEVDQEGSRDLHYQWGVGLIYGQNLTNIAVCGHGIIEGRDMAFWTPREGLTKRQKLAEVHYVPKEWRPLMFMFEGCRNVTVRDVTFHRSPMYAGWSVNCDNMVFGGVRVLHHFHGLNTDGFHFASCRTVHISDCYFHTGDDCIAVDGEGTEISECFTITNCVFESRCNVFRFYTGLCKELQGKPCGGHVRDVNVSNCSVRNASCVVNIAADRGIVERIQISGLTIRQEVPGVPFSIMADQGIVRQVRISDIWAAGNGALTINGNSGDIIEDICLRDVHFDVIPYEKEFGLGLPERGHFRLMTAYHQAPYFIYLNGAKNVKLDQVSVVWKEMGMDGSWSAIQASEVGELVVDGFTGQVYGDAKKHPVISMRNVTKAHISGCCAEDDTEVYLLVSGEMTKRVMLSNNDLFGAKQVWAGDNEHETERLRNSVVKVDTLN